MNEEIIGLDVGHKKTGLARANMTARLPEPLKSVETGQLLEEVKKLASDLKSNTIVVGLPRGLNGQDTEQTRWVRAWAQSAKAEVKADFYWQDEALTSVSADALRPRYPKADDHSIAAAIILSDFLNSPPEGRVLI